MMTNFPVPYTGLLVVYIQVPGSRSLKDRRKVLKSIVDRVNNRWSISTIDLGPDGSRTDLFLGFSLVDLSSERVRERLDGVVSFLYKMEDSGNFEIIKKWLEVDSYGKFPFGEN